VEITSTNNQPFEGDSITLTCTTSKPNVKEWLFYRVKTGGDALILQRNQTAFTFLLNVNGSEATSIYMCGVEVMESNIAKQYNSTEIEINVQGNLTLDYSIVRIS